MSLNKALSTCENSLKASINALHSLDVPAKSDTILPELQPGIGSSFITLLQQLRQTTTSVSLSFKPPITTNAAVSKLSGLEQQYGQLASCVALASGGKVGPKDSFMVKEWRDGVLDIGSQLLSLLATLNQAEQKAGESSNTENPYLARTAMVWDAIDRVHAECSTSEVDAVRRVWKGQNGIMKDAWEEFKEMLGDQDGANGESEEDDFVDDFENIFGPSTGAVLTAEERSRAEKLKPILALYFLLHSSLLRFLQDLALVPDRPYTALVSAGDKLVSVFDDTVAGLSPPQDLDVFDASLESVDLAALQLIRLVKSRLEVSKSDNAACLTFLGKWEIKLRQERLALSDHSISLNGLAQALDA